MDIKQITEKGGGKFVAEIEGKKIGYVNYMLNGDGVMTIDHTEVDDAYNGQGFAKKLVLEAANFAQQNSLKVRPTCPYANSIFMRDKELQSLM